MSRYMSGRFQAVWPWTRTDPAEGSSSPAIRWRSVDLPAPFGPRRPVTPGPSPNEMSLTATTLPYQRATWLTSRAATTGEVAGGAAGIGEVAGGVAGTGDGE